MSYNNISDINIMHELSFLKGRIDALISSLMELGCSKITFQDTGEQFLLFPTNSSQSCLLLDENGCLLAVNDVWIQTMGYARAEVIGTWFGNYLYSHDMSLFLQNILCVGKTGEISVIVVQMVRNDGSKIIVSFKATIGFDEYGIFRQIHCAFEDITDFIRFNVVVKSAEVNVHLASVWASLNNAISLL